MQSICIYPLLFLVLFCSLWPQVAESQDATKSAVAVKAVTVKQVTSKGIASLLTKLQDDAPATVLSLNNSQLASEVSGIILEMAVEVGDVVGKGAVLARLDDWLYLAQLKQAQGAQQEFAAALQQARRERDRAKKLRKKGQSTQAVLDAKVAQVEQSLARLQQQKARVDQSRSRWQKTTIRATFSGVVSQRSGQVGAWVGVGTPIVELVDIARVELSAKVASQRIPQLKIANKLQFVHLDLSYPVTIRALLPIEDAATQTREIRLGFQESRPPPGAAGRLSWFDDRDFVPPWLLVRRQQGLGIFLLKADKVFFLPLPDAREGLPALLPAGITGDVVVDGRESLQHGETVQIIPAGD